jgi:hypothetical protein
VNRDGEHLGHPYTDDEVSEIERHEVNISKEEMRELDSNWIKSSDQFRHDSFQSVVNAHEFTLINFYAGFTEEKPWCDQCADFAPIWKKFASQINSGEKNFTDADHANTDIHALRINCAQFEDHCVEQRIPSFPTIRLYQRGVQKFVEFEGELAKKDLFRFVREQVGRHHLHRGIKHHAIFNEGCELSGYILVPRVPGTMHVQAVSTKEKMLNPIFTNLSHHVRYLSFGDYSRSAAEGPLDGKTFIATGFHQAPRHFLKVMHQRFDWSNVKRYQQTHQWHNHKFNRTEAPQAKFSYDFSPVEVVVSRGGRRWYDFVTSVFAVVGGTFSIMTMIHGILRIGG